MSVLLSATRRLLVLRGRSTADAETLRRAIDNRGTAAPIPAGLRKVASVTEELVAGHRLVTLTPLSNPSGAHLVYTHGGCYVFPLVGPHWGILAGLIARTGVSVSVPLYGLAPEFTAVDAYPFLNEVAERARDVHGDRVFLGGDSAGAGLALGQAMAQRDAGLPPARGVVLISPWVDVTMSNPRVQELAPLDHMLAPAGLMEAGRLWAGGLDLRDPRVSPLYGDLSGLPPVHTYQGDRDVFLADAELLTRGIRDAGGEAELRITRGGFHDFPGAPWLPEARLALDRIADVLRS
ncbi:acetyl esterase/lipase [Frondihabitans sp. PhB188]|uniref:alpha/beta hydrolase fold domain-containing protein n=1 Tax=Frondihabitans sp. PhB188 TaxID=2485200 RepID=UPI000F45F14A|nr:alpha/beta hydrolase fold domain-containing protein [Frondihabitans sp. PhB188]ROQ39592.1 acetyl esterase/lipase [Frondihabitans sp. PhB188]